MFGQSVRACSMEQAGEFELHRGAAGEVDSHVGGAAGYLDDADDADDGDNA